mmetsp:Transcript_113015/g.319730  ORF Transcript_113015/g.319730 Transcript_113015/m.319730 type:complete len:207 (-) Transcript_113015:373-993(-)
MTAISRARVPVCSRTSFHCMVSSSACFWSTDSSSRSQTAWRCVRPTNDVSACSSSPLGLRVEPKPGGSPLWTIVVVAIVLAIEAPIVLLVPSGVVECGVPSEHTGVAAPKPRLAGGAALSVGDVSASIAAISDWPASDAIASTPRAADPGAALPSVALVALGAASTASASTWPANDAMAKRPSPALRVERLLAPASSSPELGWASP